MPDLMNFQDNYVGRGSGFLPARLDVVMERTLSPHISDVLLAVIAEQGNIYGLKARIS